MKRITKIIAIASALACLTLTSAAAAQSDSQSNNDANATPGWGYGRMFNPQTVKAVHGKVVRVETTTHGNWHGVHLQVKTESGTIPVFLGPSWFIDNQTTKIQPNDEVEISGSQITVNGHKALIASKVRTNGEVLDLRTANGRPFWAAWRRQGESGPMIGRGRMEQGREQGRMEQGRIEQGRMEQGMGGGITSPGAVGQGKGQGMGPGMMGRGMTNRGMMCQRTGQGIRRGAQARNRGPWAGRPMMANREKILAKLRKMEATLDQKVDQMNEAQGREKLQAMANVIDELVKQRDQVFNHIENILSRRQPARRPGMMGGSEYGMGGFGHGSGHWERHG